MKHIKILVVFCLLGFQNVFAGDIYATISKDNAPFANQQIRISDADGKEIRVITTDASGYFWIRVVQTGQLKLTIMNAEYGEASINFTSNNSSTNYSFELYNLEGKWQIRKQ